jgi:hypothetical protein
MEVSMFNASASSGRAMSDIDAEKKERILNNLLSGVMTREMRLGYMAILGYKKWVILDLILALEQDGKTFFNVLTLKKLTGIDKEAFVKIRDELISMGLITYRKGINNGIASEFFPNFNAIADLFFEGKSLTSNILASGKPLSKNEVLSFQQAENRLVASGKPLSSKRKTALNVTNEVTNEVTTTTEAPENLDNKSSSSFFGKETKGNEIPTANNQQGNNDPWDRVIIPGGLRIFGFNARNVVTQVRSKGIITPQELQDSIDYVFFDIRVNAIHERKLNPINDPLSYFMSILIKKGVTYTRPLNYKTQQEIEEEEKLKQKELKEKEEIRIKKLEEYNKKMKEYEEEESKKNKKNKFKSVSEAKFTIAPILE